jgi:hypothetical protein
MKTACIHRMCAMCPPLWLIRNCRRGIQSAITRRMSSGRMVLHASKMRSLKCATDLHVHQHLEVTSQIKIQRDEIGAPRRPLHRPSTAHPMTRELPVQPLSYEDAVSLFHPNVLDLWDTLSNTTQLNIQQKQSAHVHSREQRGAECYVICEYRS